MGKPRDPDEWIARGARVEHIGVTTATKAVPVRAQLLAEAGQPVCRLAALQIITPLVLQKRR